MSATPLGDAEFPGDATAVSELATTFETVASGLQEQIGQLQRHLAGVGSWQGAAHDSFKRNVDPLPDVLEDAGRRYVEAAGHLRPYAETLAQSKIRAQQILDEMHAAQARANAAGQGLREQAHYELAEEKRVQADPTGPPQRPWPGPNHQANLDHARSEVDDLHRQLLALHRSFEECAAQTSRGLIVAAQVGEDPGGVSGFIEKRFADLGRLKDNFTDFMDKYGFAALEALSDALALVGGALTLAAIIPGVGTVVAGVGLVLTAASLAVNLALLLGGRKSLLAWATGTALTLAPFVLKGAGARLLGRAAAKETNLARAAGRQASKTALALADDAGRSANRFDEAINASVIGAKNAVLGRAPLTGIKMRNLMSDGAFLPAAASRSSLTKVVDLSPAGTRAYVAGHAVDVVTAGNDLFDGLLARLSSRAWTPAGVVGS